MFHIYALKTAAKLFPQNEQFNDAVNDLFGHLKREYEKNFDDIALRMGNMILALSMLEVIWRLSW